MTIDIYKVASELLEEITKLSLGAEKDFHVAEGMKKGVVALYERIKETIEADSDSSSGATSTGAQGNESSLGTGDEHGGVAEAGAGEAAAADEAPGAANS